MNLIKELLILLVVAAAVILGVIGLMFIVVSEGAQEICEFLEDEGYNATRAQFPDMTCSVDGKVIRTIESARSFVQLDTLKQLLEEAKK